MNALELPVHLLLDSRRFWSKVDTAGSCWLWRASRDRHGYGQFRLDGTMRRAHRVAYVLLVGPISEGLTLDHLCKDRRCVNPAHLEPVTVGENARRGESFNKRKTHCPSGHRYDEQNTWFDTRGWRYCLACRRAKGADPGAPADDGAGVNEDAA